MKGILKLNEPLAPYTSWHVGGKADKYYRPFDLDDLSLFLANLPEEEPITWLGLGSNVLISDQGIRGVVVHMLGSHSALTRPSGTLSRETGEGMIVRAEAGMTCGKLAKLCAREGLTGAEFFAGIPGTVGGALAMNAGAWGGETWRYVVKVEVINRRGERFIRNPSEYQIGYRSVIATRKETEWFVAGYFQFEKGDPKLAAQQIKALLQERNIKQPIGVFSCGSVFKNPDGDHAGRLIEASKLKGFKIGGAEISAKHANFILNTGEAYASDIFKLIKHIKEIVWHDHQIHLQTEVKFLGQFAEC